MKSVYKDNLKTIKPPYPKLMKFVKNNSNGVFIVLMKCYSEGTVIFSENPSWKVGDVEDSWNMSEFEDHIGSVTISSEDYDE